MEEELEAAKKTEDDDDPPRNVEKVVGRDINFWTHQCVRVCHIDVHVNTDSEYDDAADLK